MNRGSATGRVEAMKDQNKWMAGLLVAILVMALLLGAVPRLPPQTQASQLPSEIRIGLDRNRPECVFRAGSGNYRLVDGNNCSIPGVGNDSWFKVTIASGSELQVWSRAGGGGDASGGSEDWSLVGTATQKVLFLPDSGASGQGKDGARFRWQDRLYRGGLEVVRAASGESLLIINVLGLEDYLLGVLPREMSDSWPQAALQAQAVAARTYALRNLRRHSGEGFNLCAGTDCQVYGGASCETVNCSRAVQETRGQVLVDKEGGYVDCLYHSNSGGYLEDNKNVNGRDIYYLRAKPDPYSLGYGLSDWTFKTVVAGKDDNGNAGLLERLRQEGLTIGRIVGIDLQKFASGRVDQVVLTEDSGRKVNKSGGQLASLFNPGFRSVGKDQFMGRLFDIETDASYSVQNGEGSIQRLHGGIGQVKVQTASGMAAIAEEDAIVAVVGSLEQGSIARYPNRLTVEGHGWGHGVGLSQWGAYGMAKQGYQGKEILAFYYPGTQLLDLE